MLKTLTLKNGIRVATYKLPDLKSLNLKITVKGGSILETNGKTGLAHFLEHMLVQGIPSLPTAEAMSEHIEGLAGNFNASTGESTINFWITLPGTKIEDAIKIASEVFFEPLFPEDAIEKERRAILEEVKQRMDSRGYKLGKFFRENRFKKGSLLTRSVGGKITDVKKITKKDMLAFWKKIFVPKNTYISICGSFDDENLKQLLTKYFEPYRETAKAPALPTFKTTELAGKKVAVRYDSKLKSNYIDLSFPSVTFGKPLLLRLEQGMLLSILTNLSRSRMFRLLRHQKGLVYGINASSYLTNELGYTVISSETSLENLEEVITLIIQELRAFAKNGPTEEELAKTKDFLGNRWLMSFDHPSSIAGWIDGDLVWEERINLPEDLIKAVEKTTVGDLVNLMKKHWDFSRVNLTIQGTTKNTKENIAKLTKIVNGL